MTNLLHKFPVTLVLHASLQHSTRQLFLFFLSFPFSAPSPDSLLELDETPLSISTPWIASIYNTHQASYSKPLLSSMFTGQQSQLYGLNRQQQQQQQQQVQSSSLQGNIGYGGLAAAGAANLPSNIGLGNVRNPNQYGAAAAGAGAPYPQQHLNAPMGGLSQTQGDNLLATTNMSYKQALLPNNNLGNFAGNPMNLNSPGAGVKTSLTGLTSSANPLGNLVSASNNSSANALRQLINPGGSIQYPNYAANNHNAAASSAATSASNSGNSDVLQQNIDLNNPQPSNLGTEADFKINPSSSASLLASIASSNKSTLNTAIENKNTEGSNENASEPANNNSTSIGQSLAPRQTSDDDKVFTWIMELMHGPNSEEALFELGKKREQYDDLALILWHSFGVMTCLLQEIIYVYPLLSPPQLTSTASNRVCNALALLQCIASHDSTRKPFLEAHIPLFLYPFLSTTPKSRSFEYLRLTSLGVIGALVKNDSPEVIQFLLSTEIIPLCLRIMESGTELSKTVAIFILQKILMDDAGLDHICQTYERFSAVSNVLSDMVKQLVESPTTRLLKHVVRCYLRLSDNDQACNQLKNVLPEPLRDATFSNVLKDDGATKRCLGQLLSNLSDP